MLLEMKTHPAVAPNTITFNSLLDCCVRCFDMPLAASIFNDMQTGRSHGIKPDLITYSTMIKGYCKDRNIEQALETL